MKYKLILTNTLFQHKMAHRTTWECPERKTEHQDAQSKETRRNPYRNQIDYILTRTNHRNFVTNSRSYSGIETYTDHRLVKANFQINFKLVRQKNAPKQQKINVERLKDPVCRILYCEAVSNQLLQLNKSESPQEK